MTKRRRFAFAQPHDDRDVHNREEWDQKTRIKSHRKVAMSVDPGAVKITRSGPGAEVTPGPTAARRSVRPTIFQSNTTARELGAFRKTSQASGRAAAPARISPQPATGANGAESRPRLQSRRAHQPEAKAALHGKPFATFCSRQGQGRLRPVVSQGPAPRPGASSPSRRESRRRQTMRQVQSRFEHGSASGPYREVSARDGNRGCRR